MQKVRYNIAVKVFQFQGLFTLFQKCFSPFLHSTSSLSVIGLYLGLNSGLLIFIQTFTNSELLILLHKLTICTGLTPILAIYSKIFQIIKIINKDLVQFRSPLLPESPIDFYFPKSTKMFQFLQ